MLQEIKFDFFKVFKSKSIIITIIATSLFLCINPIIMQLVQKSEMSALRCYVGDTTPALCVIIFSTVFCSMDFEKGFIKNIYTNTNKFRYVLSKALVILLYSLYISVFLIVVNIIICYTGGIKQIIQPIGKYTGDSFTIGDVICYTLVRTVGLTAVGLLTTLLAILLKTLVVSIAMFLWFFVCGSIYQLIDSIVNYAIEPFGTRYYTLFGNLNSSYITSFWHSTYKIPDFAIHTLVVYLIYGVVFFLLSWLALSKKEV